MLHGRITAAPNSVCQEVCPPCCSNGRLLRDLLDRRGATFDPNVRIKLNVAIGSYKMGGVQVTLGFSALNSAI